VESGLQLVMAGKPWTEAMRQFVTERNLQDEVVELLNLENEQLRALYSRAKALLFPSLYEGFGLPVIEAQACGCPVFTSNRAPLTESVVTRLSTLIRAARAGAQIVADHWGATDRMSTAGLENVKRFSTQKMIDEYIQVYEHILSRHRS
jgi:glycosyltransferase involved in cell wall biosynthesis